MDTKWKKSRKFTGMISGHIFTVCFILSIMFWVPVCFMENEFDWNAIQHNDYQETTVFREGISRYVNQIFYSFSEFELAHKNTLRILARNGGELASSLADRIYYYMIEQGIPLSLNFAEVMFKERALILEQTSAIKVEEAYDPLIAVDSAPAAELQEAGSGSDARLSQNVTVAGDTSYEYYITQKIGVESYSTLYDFNKAVQENRNVLYTIGVGDQILYTNDQTLGFYSEEFLMPQGYNFLLHYDGNEIQITKEGKPVDIYGDGFYRDGGWYLPGYANFQMKDEWKNARITLVAMTEPQEIPAGSDFGFGDWRGQYLIVSNLHNQLKLQIGIAIIGLCFLFLSILFRKSGREGNIQLAALTKKIWLEPKIMIFIFITYSCAVVVMQWLDHFWGGIDSYSVTSLKYYGGAAFFYIPVFLLWLIINEIYYERENFKSSGAYFVYHAFSCSARKLPYSRRILIENGLVFFLQWCLIAVFFIVLFLLYTGRMDIDAYGITIFSLLMIVCILISFFQLLIFYRHKRMTDGVEGLADQIKQIHGGALVGSLTLSEESGLKETGEYLNDIGTGMDEALEEKVKSERMKVELITNVSHDIKTPLTSIISYVELMKQEELPEHVKEYVQIIDHKSKRLKTMVQDVFEVSKAASGQLPVHLKILDLSKLIQQTMADMQEQLQEAPVIMKTDIPELPILIEADGDRLYRVFQNLIQNAVNYSLEGSRIYIQLMVENQMATASVRNISREELAQDVDYTERFVRGDTSRTDTGSGLGLSIAKGFAEACGGTLKVEVISDLFIVTVAFPLKTEEDRDIEEA